MQCHNNGGAPISCVRGVAAALCGWLRHGGGQRWRFDLGQSEHNFNIYHMRLGRCAWKVSCWTVFSMLVLAFHFGSASGLLPCGPFHLSLLFGFGKHATVSLCLIVVVQPLLLQVLSHSYQDAVGNP